MAIMNDARGSGLAIAKQNLISCFGRSLAVLADISWSEADRAHLCNSPVSL